MKNMYFIGNYPTIKLNITKSQAAKGCHQGQCDNDIETLSAVPAIKRQIDKLDPGNLSKELKEYGAWDADELKDHEQNKRRILWIACGCIMDGFKK